MHSAGLCVVGRASNKSINHLDELLRDWPADRRILFVVIALFLWHAAHRLRITLHDFGARRDAAIAWGVYTAAGVGTLAAAFVLARLA